MEPHDCNFHDALQRCINERCPLHRAMRTLTANLAVADFGAAMESRGAEKFLDGIRDVRSRYAALMADASPTLALELRQMDRRLVALLDERTRPGCGNPAPGFDEGRK